MRKNMRKVKAMYQVPTSMSGSKSSLRSSSRKRELPETKWKRVVKRAKMSKLQSQIKLQRGDRANEWSCTSFAQIQRDSGVKVFHHARDRPVEPWHFGQEKAALDAKTSAGASGGLSCFDVQWLSCVLKKPGDVDERRAKARDQAHEFSGAFEQSCWRFSVSHCGGKRRVLSFLKQQQSVSPLTYCEIGSFRLHVQRSTETKLF